MTSDEAPWLLNVHWPDDAHCPEAENSADVAVPNSTAPQSVPSRVAERNLEGLKTAGKYLVSVTDREVLIVDVVQTADHALVTRLEVDIEP
ncbi:MAG: hypothetical protein FJ194_12830 [Gammaproteobacteria bacterium]|nr:hypothetical protein [Gammaproteobacteria bacterium]